MTAGEIDILVATQAAAKGHNFPNLTLVGVIDADLSLRGGDLRAGERTFQLLAQVSGRAGRHERPGRAMLQTYDPSHPVLQAIAAQDRDAFVSAEMDARQLAGLPPYGRLAALILSGPDGGALETYANALAVYGESGQVREEDWLAPAAIDQRTLYQGNTVLRGGQTPKVETARN